MADAARHGGGVMNVPRLAGDRRVLGPTLRVGFALLATWVVVVVTYGAFSESVWLLNTPLRITLAAATLPFVVAPVVHPTPTTGMVGSLALVFFASAQTIRVQWAEYPWRPRMVATATYGAVGTLALMLSVYIVTVTMMLCAGRGAASDDGR